MAKTAHKSTKSKAVAPKGLDRLKAVPAILGSPDDTLFVTGLAGTARDIAHFCGDRQNYYTMAGAMGGAAAMGLGLALAQPDKKVIVVTGDGELLMNSGTLATIGVMNPPNLSILCVDNGHYGETGNQLSHTSLGVDLAAIASGSGIATVRTVTTEADVADGAKALRESNGCAFVLMKVAEGPPPTVKRSLDAAYTKNQFRLGLLGEG